MKEIAKSFLRSIGRFIAYFLLLFLISCIVKSCDVNAARADIFQGTYTCYKGGTVLSTGNVSAGPGDLYSDGLNLVYKCPSGWTNVNFSLLFNMSGVGNMQTGWDITLKWISTSGSQNNRILSIDNNTEGLANPNPGGINLVSGTIGSGNRYNFAVFGNGGSNNQVLQGLRIGSDDDKLLLSQYLAGQKNFDEVTSALQSSMNSIINNQNANKNEIINNQNQNQAQTNEKLDETNENLENINDSITSTEGANLDSLGDSAGWLPAGPIDSILNLPLSFLTNLLDNLSGTCTPLTVQLPFVEENLTIPCINSLYNQIEGVSTWINTISLIPCALILFRYFMFLYKWVDDTLSFRENNYIDNWGGI